MTAYFILITLLLTSQIQADFFYDEPLAKELGAMAFASYCPSDAIMNWQTGYVSANYPDITKIEVFEKPLLGTKGFIAYSKTYNAIQIIFRGSENYRNYFEDISLIKTQFNTQCQCKVHEGFKMAYESLKPLVDQLLPEYRAKYPYASLHVAGHSLGGAMATLFATELSMAGFEVTLVTLGSPRVGDSAFFDWANKLKITHYRIVNDKDYAPHLPPMNYGFEHLNREIWYKEQNYVVCQEVKGEDKNCSYSVKIPKFDEHTYYLGWTKDNDC